MFWYVSCYVSVAVRMMLRIAAVLCIFAGWVCIVGEGTTFAGVTVRDDYIVASNLVQRFQSSVTVLDEKALNSLFANDKLVEAWKDELREYKHRNKRPDIEISITRVVRGAECISVETRVSSRDGDVFEFKDHEWLFRLIYKNKVWKIAGIEQKTLARLNGRFDVATVAVHDLARFVEQKKWRSLCSLVGLDTSVVERSGSVSDYQNLLRTNGLAWLLDLVVRGDENIRLLSVSRHVEHLGVEIGIFNQAGKVMQTRHCLFMESQDGKYTLRFDGSSSGMMRPVSNFWMALQNCDCVAICEFPSGTADPKTGSELSVTPQADKAVRRNKHGMKTDVSLRKIVFGSSTEVGRVKVPSILQYQFMFPGLYLVPLFGNADGIMPGYFRVPRIAADLSEYWGGVIRAWRACDSASESRTYLTEKVLGDKRLSVVHADAVRYLFKTDRSYGNTVYKSPALSKFWQDKLFSDVVSPDGRCEILKALIKVAPNGDDAEKLLVKALEDDVLSSTAAYIFYRRNPSGFKRMMRAWLSDDTRSKLAKDHMIRLGLYKGGRRK